MAAYEPGRVLSFSLPLPLHMRHLHLPHTLGQEPGSHSAILPILPPAPTSYLSATSASPPPTRSLNPLSFLSTSLLLSLLAGWYHCPQTGLPAFMGPLHTVLCWIWNALEKANQISPLPSFLLQYFFLVGYPPRWPQPSPCTLSLSPLLPLGPPVSGAPGLSTPLTNCLPCSSLTPHAACPS